MKTPIHRPHLLLALLALFVLGSAFLPNGSHQRQGDTPRIILANPGQSEIGTVVSENETLLELNVQPCEEAETVRFVDNYTMSFLHTIQCDDGSSVDLYNVVQHSF